MSNFKFVNIDMSIVHAYSPLPCFLLYIIMRSSTRYKIEQVTALSLTDWVLARYVYVKLVSRFDSSKPSHDLVHYLVSVS